MTLIDTSAWIHSLRSDGDPAVTRRVRALLESGQAVWCPMVRLELWNGARGDHEKQVLKSLERDIPELPVDREVWSTSFELARKARQNGIAAPATDLLIAACARHHGADIEHDDGHLTALADL
jgi:predicted nucleic acid-binding protein